MRHLNKLKSFLGQQIGWLCMCATIQLVIWLVFLLFNLPLEVFEVLFWLVLIVMLGYLVFRAVHYQKVSTQHERIQELKTALQTIQAQSDQQRHELEEYFIMWVHQMKTPITASQLLLKHADPTTFPLLRQEMLAIETYTDMALNYLKLSNPATDMHVSRIMLDELIKPLLRKYSVQFINKRIQLIYEPILVEVVTEANLASLMIEQILSNALKYTDRGSISISFSQANSHLYIKDTGKGINSADLPRIFDKGFSGMNGQLNQKSSGIGLYLVRLISKRLEQAVSVSSQTNQGSEFIIVFHQAP